MTRRPWAAWLLAATAAFSAALAPTSASASDVKPWLARARAEMDAVRYDAAIQVLDQARRLGRSSPTLLAEVYRLSGEAAAALGDEPTAEAMFKKLCAIAPDSRPPVGASPRIVAPFDAALAYFRDRTPLRVRHEIVAGQAPSIALVVESDPLSMVAGVRVTYRTFDGIEELQERHGSDRIAVSLPPDRRMEVVLSAIDEHGNQLAGIGSRSEPIVIASGPLPPPPDAAGSSVGDLRARPAGAVAARPLYARWYLWGGLAAASGASGAYFALQMRAAEQDLARLAAGSMGRPYAEAVKLEERGRRYALAANLSFAAAVASTIAAVALGIAGADDPPAAARATWGLHLIAGGAPNGNGDGNGHRDGAMVTVRGLF